MKKTVVYMINDRPSTTLSAQQFEFVLMRVDIKKIGVLEVAARESKSDMEPIHRIGKKK
jgi:hypothetical protein